MFPAHLSARSFFIGGGISPVGIARVGQSHARDGVLNAQNGGLRGGEADLYRPADLPAIPKLLRSFRLAFCGLAAPIIFFRLARGHNSAKCADVIEVLAHPLSRPL